MLEEETEEGNPANRGEALYRVTCYRDIYKGMNKGLASIQADANFNTSEKGLALTVLAYFEGDRL